MKYIKKFEKISQFEDFKNGSEWITPNVSYIVENKGCKFQPYIPPPQKIVNYIRAYIDGLKWYMEWDYPTDSDVYVYDDAFGKMWFKKGEQIKSSIAPPATTTVTIYAIGLTSAELDLNLQECEDDTYIYRIKND